MKRVLSAILLIFMLLSITACDQASAGTDDVGTPTESTGISMPQWAVGTWAYDTSSSDRATDYGNIVIKANDAKFWAYDGYSTDLKLVTLSEQIAAGAIVTNQAISSSEYQLNYNYQSETDMVYAVLEIRNKNDYLEVYYNLSYGGASHSTWTRKYIKQEL